MAIDGVSFDPNPRRISHIYKRVLGKFTQVLSKVRVEGKFVRALSKANRKGRKRKRNDMGKVVSFATQEVTTCSETETLEEKNEVVNDLKM